MSHASDFVYLIVIYASLHFKLLNIYIFPPQNIAVALYFECGNEHFCGTWNIILGILLLLLFLINIVRFMA